MKRNHKYPYILDQLYKILIVGCSKIRETKAILSLKSDINKIFL